MTLGADSSVMRSLACTGGVHAGTETGVFGTSVEDGDADCEVVVVDDPFEPHAATSNSKNEVKATAASRIRVRRLVSDNVN